MNFPYEIFYSEKNPVSEFEVWDTHAFHQLLSNRGEKKSLRSTERLLSVSGLLPDVVQFNELLDEHDKPPRWQVISSLASVAKKRETCHSLFRLIAMLRWALCSLRTTGVRGVDGYF